MIDELKDENVTLKLKVADIEGDLLEERETKQVRYDITLETVKSQLQEQYLDQKVRMEEDLIGHKESNYRLKVDLQGLEERNSVLKQ